MGGELRRHADSVVPDMKLIGPPPVRHLAFLRNPYLYFSAVRRILHRVAEKIQQNLVQPELVANDILIRYVGEIDRQFLILGLRKIGHHGADIFGNPRKITGTVFKLYFAAFNPAHFQHVIDERQQMIAGSQDFVKILPRFLLIIDALSGKVCEAYNRVHRRANIVGHIGKKRRFRRARRLGLFQRLLQLSILLLLFAAYFRRVGNE